MRKFSLVYGLLTFLTLTVPSCKKTADEPVTTFHFYDSMPVAGYTRSYVLNLPPNYNDSSNFSLVIALHGLGSSGSQMGRDYKLTNKSNSAGFVIVYPEGVRSDGRLGIRTWNVGTCCDCEAIWDIRPAHCKKNINSYTSSS